ncbi:MAG: molybdopterin-dependent oxidoreductase [Chloroflexota bacterium]|nr:molybdopterin-dependent oxidoreductase [Chloroflexota bacterium]MDE2883861.1 molybdopterin-dependent oxidoreductase [Chloroflexota bacterium]
MPLTRRQFLKWAGVTSIGAVVFNGCRVPDHEIQVQSPVEMPEDLVTGRDNYYATAAQLGMASEGLLVRVMEGRAKKIEGNPDHPVNTGKHGIRAEALLQALYHPDRIKHPLIRIAKGGPFVEIGWDDGIRELVRILNGRDQGEVLLATPLLRGRVADVVKAFADGSGVRLQGFDPLGCESVVREALRQLYGQNTQPDFDIAHASYILNFGADFLGTWVNPTHFSRGYGEFRQGAGRSRGRLVHVGARYSTTAAAADHWVYATPGSEGLLAMAIAYTIIDEGTADADAASALTGGQGARALQAFAPDSVAWQTGVDAHVITELAHELADSHNRPALVIGGGPSAAQENGLFNMIAVYALNALVGSVNRPGGLVFNPEPVSGRIRTTSLRDWKQTLADMRSGDITAVLVRDADLAYGLPGELDARGALRSVETIVSFSSFLDETSELADLILPCHTPLEEWGTDEPNPGPGYTTVGFQQPAVRPFHETWSFGDVLLSAGSELGLSDLPGADMREAVRSLAMELHERKRGSVVQPTFVEFWKRTLERGGWWDIRATADGSRPELPALPSRPPNVSPADSKRYPLHLVPFEGIGVGAGQYAHLPWAQSAPDPITSAVWDTWVELNPHTADELGLKNNDVVIVESSTGRTIRVPVYINPATPPSVAAVPMGQGHRAFTSYAARRGANVLDILEPAEDAETGAFAWGATRVRVSGTTRTRVVPKLEGIEPARQLHGEELIYVHKA